MAFVSAGILTDFLGQRGRFVALELSDYMFLNFTGDNSHFDIQLNGTDTSFNVQAGFPDDRATNHGDLNWLAAQDWNMRVGHDCNLEAGRDINIIANWFNDFSDPGSGAINMRGTSLQLGFGEINIAASDGINFGGATLSGANLDMTAGSQLKLPAVASAPLPAGDPDTFVTVYDGAGNPFNVPGWTTI